MLESFSLSFIAANIVCGGETGEYKNL